MSFTDISPDALRIEAVAKRLCHLMTVNNHGRPCRVEMDGSGRFDCACGQWRRAMDWAATIVRAHDAVDPLRMFCKPPSE
jgi:hypothetical protein